MKNLGFFAGIMFAFGLQTFAQETYEIATIEQAELTGTARHIGMGGAMEALGADISTISTNPAGIGLFRKSQVLASLGVVSMADASKTFDVSPTRFSFDQAGFVYSTNTSDSKTSFINFAFNYSKSRNFSQILSAANSLIDASQNKQTVNKFMEGIISSDNDAAYSQVDYLYFNNLMADYGDTCYNANAYDMERGTKGYISNYDFNLSLNNGNRVFVGFTVGIKDVRYHAQSCYGEMFSDAPVTSLAITDDRRITGTGVDFKAGIIFRPIETSPFRIGLSVSTPTFYNLRSSNITRIDHVGASSKAYASINESYRYKFNTPWKFAVSAGHTFGQMLAAGVSWEYVHYPATSPRIDNGDYIDSWGYSYGSSYQDNAMKYNVEQSLKASHTVKAGLELKPVSSLAVRLGFNYVTPMYKEDGYRDPSVASWGNGYSSQTDFTNWKATYRVTAGLGYSTKHFFADVAYQYSSQKGDFYPFTSFISSYSEQLDNIPTITEVKNDRHQVLLTLGYKF